MSALPPRADIRQRIEHVCLVPIADITEAAAGAGQDRRGGVLVR